MYALSGVMRSGASRSDYYQPNVFVTIGGVSWTSRILKPSMRIEENIDNLANTARFRVRSNATRAGTASIARSGIARSGITRCGYYALGSFIANTGPEIIISIGSTANRLFAGYVMSTRVKAFRRSQRRPIVEYGCCDYNWFLDRYRITGKRWTSASATTILTDILTYLPSSHGFTLSIEAGLATLDSFQANHLETISQVITRLAKRLGARWYVDYNKVVHLFESPETTNQPSALSDSQRGFWDLDVDTDMSQARTRAYVIGGSTTTTAVAAAGATSIAVDDTRLFGASGGEALIGANRITYTGKSVAQGPGNLTGVPGSGAGSIVYDVAQAESVRILATRNDTTAQAALASRIGTNGAGVADDGIVAETVQDGRCGDQAARDLGDGELLLASLVPQAIGYKTLDKFSQTGKAVPVSVLQPVVVNNTFMIQRVVLDQLGIVNRFPRRTVEAGGTRIDLMDVLQSATRSGRELGEE